MDNEILKELNEAMNEIPFDKSKFQIENIVISHQSPERNLRQVLLQINEKLHALNEAKFRRKRLEIDLEEKKDSLNKVISCRFKEARMKIDIEEIEYKLKDEEKFIKDAMIDLSYYYEIFKKLPKITREDFEKSEHKYWIDRLLYEAKSEWLSTNRISQGTIQSLQKIGAEIKFLPEKNDYQIIFNEKQTIEHKDK